MAIPGVPVCHNKIAEAFRLKRGIITHTADYLGIAPSTIYDAINTDSQLKQVLEDARKAYADSKVDEDVAIVYSARESIKTLLAKNDVTATIFTLKTKDAWVEKRDAPVSDPNSCLQDLCDKEHSQE